MRTKSIEPTPQKGRSWPRYLLGGFILTAILGVAFVRSHPIIFNESFFSHAHCMPQATLALLGYAEDHYGRFPMHTNGYGDALLLLSPRYAHPSVLTGPGYDTEAFLRWAQVVTNVPETACGRVYVEGLTRDSNVEIAILFDKVPNPGDHRHLLGRIWSPQGRDVGFCGGFFRFIPETKWVEFASNQIELLVKEGFDRAAAEAIYAEKGRER